MINIPTLFILLIIHWAADYTHLSRPYMLAAKRLGTPLKPIVHHAAIHASLMFFALLILTNPMTAVWGLLIQFWSHFVIDVWKGRMNGWFPSLQNPTNYFHWYIFGLDQLLHISIIILIASL